MPPYLGLTFKPSFNVRPDPYIQARTTEVAEALVLGVL